MFFNSLGPWKQSFAHFISSIICIIWSFFLQVFFRVSFVFLRLCRRQANPPVRMWIHWKHEWTEWILCWELWWQLRINLHPSLSLKWLLSPRLQQLKLYLLYLLDLHVRIKFLLIILGVCLPIICHKISIMLLKLLWWIRFLQFNL